MKAFDITWVEVNELERGRGHGVEFLYSDSRGSIIAFLEGYNWMHEGKGAVKVYILTPEAGIFKESSEDGNSIVEDAKSTVLYFLKKKALWKHGKIGDKFFAWFNA